MRLARWALLGVAALFPAQETRALTLHIGQLSVMAMSGDVNELESATDALETAIGAVGIDKAIAECKEAHKTGTPPRSFVESELNQLGYKYLGKQKLDEAIAVFELNTELYPDSWNVYDSLGEAHLARGDASRGDRRRSAELYSKSLAMRERSANRRQPADKVLDAAGVKPGMVVGEVGAGHGRYTVHLADRVGDTGKVYANDIDEARLDILRLRCEHERLGNVEIILGDVEDPRFPESALDAIFMVWVYHMVEEPVPLLASFASSLKPGAQVVMVEPIPEEIEEEREHARSHGHGDVHVNVLTEEVMKDYASQAGFRLVKTITDLLEMDVIYILERE